MTIGIISIVAASMLLTVVVVGITNLLDSSPTKDEECRGGHDF